MTSTASAGHGRVELKICRDEEGKKIIGKCQSRADGGRKTIRRPIGLQYQERDMKRMESGAADDGWMPLDWLSSRRADARVKMAS